MVIRILLFVCLVGSVAAHGASALAGSSAAAASADAKGIAVKKGALEKELAAVVTPAQLRKVIAAGGTVTGSTLPTQPCMRMIQRVEQGGENELCDWAENFCKKFPQGVLSYLPPKKAVQDAKNGASKQKQ